MGGGVAEERKNQRQEMVSLPLPDEILAEIFLRLPTPADLVRASAACISFRRVAADRSLLRRFRKLHAPPILGFLEKDRTFHPAVPSHPSSSAASVAKFSFSFSFLPARARHWVVRDSRDGRVLLCRPIWHDFPDHKVAFREMVVCDPLHRRYLLLPPIPDDLAASVEDPFIIKSERLPETFLVSPGEDELAADAAEDTSFRVICMVQCKFKLFTFVFSSSTGQWRALPSQSWCNLFAHSLSLTTMRRFYLRQYAYGCFYWMSSAKEEMKMLVLDTPRMEFSIAELPPEAKNMFLLDITIVEAEEGRPGMFVLVHGRSDLSYTILRCNGVSSSQWQSEKTISLGSGYSLRGAVGRYLVLYWWGSSSLERCYFTLDTKTLQLEKVCTAGKPYLHTYSNFPPSLLSSPTISSGTPKGAEEAALEQDTEVLQAEVHSQHDPSTADANAGDHADVSRIGDGAD